MNKKFLFNTVLFASAAMFAACDYNEDNFDGLSDGYVPSDIKKIEYTMTPADYQAVSKNKVNKDSAEINGVSKELSNVAKHNAFSDAIPAEKYMLTFLSEKFFTADDGSSIKVTYEKDLDWSDEMKTMNGAELYKVSNEDYEAIWGANFNFFSPVETAAKHVPAILKEKFAEAKAGDAVFVDYNVSDSEPAGAVVAINENFEAEETEGWTMVVTKGNEGDSWVNKKYNDNGYVQASAFKAEGEMEAYIISPRFNVVKDMMLSFDACYGHYKEAGGRLSVWLLETGDDISGYTPEQIAAAKWVDITEDLNIPVPEGNYGVLGNVYSKDLSAFAGKKVYLAFRYNGNHATEATTTVQVDNVLVKSEGTGESENVVIPATGAYEFDGEVWKQNEKVYTMTKADFNAMGNRHDNFSDKTPASKYLPQFLTLKYPYAQEGQKKTVVYKYYKGETSVRADEYVVVNGEWTKSPKTETVTDQFVLNGGSWSKDPSTVIELSPVKNETSILYYQTATDWVWENIDVAQLGAQKKGEGYVSHYGNNEYYTGCSAHYCNVDMRADKARGQYAKGYEGMNDEQVVAEMQKHLIEVMKYVLETLHKDVVPVPGDKGVIFTIKMGVYTGIQLTDCNYEMKYKVVAPGTFEYVEGSYQPIVK